VKQLNAVSPHTQGMKIETNLVQTQPKQGMTMKTLFYDKKAHITCSSRELLRMIERIIALATKKEANKHCNLENGKTIP